MDRVYGDIIHFYSVLVSYSYDGALCACGYDIFYDYIVNVDGLALHCIFIRFSCAIEARERDKIIARVAVEIFENYVIAA